MWNKTQSYPSFRSQNDKIIKISFRQSFNLGTKVKIKALRSKKEKIRIRARSNSETAKTEHNQRGRWKNWTIEKRR